MISYKNQQLPLSSSAWMPHGASGGLSQDQALLAVRYFMLQNLLSSIEMDRNVLQMETTGPVITKVKFGSQLKAGDIVTVEVNLFRKEVVFYRNQAREWTFKILGKV